MKFQVYCPYCDEIFKFASKMIGTTFKCTKCNQTFTIPDPETQTHEPESCNPESEPTSDNTKNVKKCPYCGEEILKTAIKCKHCKEFLNEEPNKRVITADDNMMTRNRGCGDLILYGPLIFIFLVLVTRGCN